MKIPNLFKKGKEEQEEIDQIIQENITAEKEEKKEEEPTEEVKMESQPAAIKKLRMDLDKLKAGTTALREMSKINEERFQRISEEIGEIRRAGIERERKIDKTKLEAKKAVELVNQVQPQNLMKEVRKEDVKLQAVDAEEKADRELLKHITDEVKNIRATMTAFRGMEALIEMNEEMKREIETMRRVELTTKKHADKVENIYVRVQKSFNEFFKLSQEFKSLEKGFREVMEESEKFKRRYRDLVKKEDLMNFQEEINEKLSFVDKTKGELEKLIPQVKSSSSEAKTLEKRLTRRLTELDDELSKLARMGQENYVTEEKFNQELDDFFNNILRKLEKIETKIKIKR